jgi:hypothetical protein
MEKCSMQQRHSAIARQVAEKIANKLTLINNGKLLNQLLASLYTSLMKFLCSA